MPEVFIAPMVERARSLDESVIKNILQSTFISHGGPDEAFARKVYEAIHRNGVRVFFLPEHAGRGEVAEGGWAQPFITGGRSSPR
jgi:hypothetical protein